MAPRRDVQPWPSFLDPQALPATLRDLLRAVQAARRDIASAGEDWQRLAGAVRPHLPALWTAASADERLRFIRHLRPYWELGLHRAAPSPTPGCRMRAAPAASAITQAACCACRPPPVAASRSAGARGESRPQTLLVDRVFNTRGFEFDWTRIDDALLRNLLGKGLAVPHETGFGIAADPATGEVAQRHGQRPGLYAVGHPLRGVSWESNAIGEQIAGATATVTALAEQLRSAAETGFFPSAGTAWAGRPSGPPDVLAQQAVEPERFVLRDARLQARGRQPRHAAHFAAQVRLVGEARAAGQPGPVDSAVPAMRGHARHRILDPRIPLQIAMTLAGPGLDAPLDLPQALASA